MANATRIADYPRGHFVGSYAGTTAAQNIHIGFKPSLILAWNVTDGNVLYMWTSASLTTVAALVDAGCSETALTANASVITQVDNGTVLGFALPACDTVVNENAKTYAFIAFPA